MPSSRTNVRDLLNFGRFTTGSCPSPFGPAFGCSNRSWRFSLPLVEMTVSFSYITINNLCVLRVSAVNNYLRGGDSIQILCCCVGSVDAELVEQDAVVVFIRIGCGQQLVAVEDGVGAGEETQRLHLVAHFAAAG